LAAGSHFPIEFVSTSCQSAAGSASAGGNRFGQGHLSHRPGRHPTGGSRGLGDQWNESLPLSERITAAREDGIDKPTMMEPLDRHVLGKT
jgi:hypothetical protein